MGAGGWGGGEAGSESRIEVVRWGDSSTLVFFIALSALLFTFYYYEFEVMFLYRAFPLPILPFQQVQCKLAIGTGAASTSETKMTYFLLNMNSATTVWTVKSRFP